MQNPQISIIAAIGKNRELGKNNKLLWNIPEDLKRFRDITRGHPVIMGRKTFDSIGRVLPGRSNIVITRDSENFLDKARKDGHDLKNLIVTGSLKSAIELAEKTDGSEEIFVIGGGQIFEEAINIVGKLYLTIVEQEFDADTFFPEYSEQFKSEVFREEGAKDEYKYIFIDLEK